MRRGYIRERQYGPSVEDQRRTLGAAGVPTDGTHPPIYTDMIADVKSTPKAWKLLAQRKAAIASLRPGDALAVWDAATLGRDMEEIQEGLAMVGKRQATLVICYPDEREFTWHPEAAEIANLAAEGSRQLRSEKHARAAAKHLGAAPKLIGANLDIARRLWGDPSLTARAVPGKILEATGIKVSERLLWQRLGPKSEAENGKR